MNFLPHIDKQFAGQGGSKARTTDREDKMKQLILEELNNEDPISSHSLSEYLAFASNPSILPIVIFFTHSKLLLFPPLRVFPII